MTLTNAASCTFDAVFYEKGVFVDMRTVDMNTATFLKKALDTELENGSFKNMTKYSEVTLTKEFGTFMFDADNDEDVARFLNFWTFPCSRKLTGNWTVILSLTKKTVYDNNGQVIESESW